MRTLSAVLATLAIAASTATAQTSTFFITVGSDTFAVEQFTRTEKQFTSNILMKLQGVRLRVDATAEPGGKIPHLESRVWQATAALDAPPLQAAVVSLQGDSAKLDITQGGQTRPLTIPIKDNPIIYVNPSFAVMEVVLERAKAMGGSRVEVPMLALAGGRPFTATVSYPSPDSAVVGMASGDARFAVDRQGRIVGGGIPSQKLVITRREGASGVALVAPKPDYSAPAGAPYTAENVVVPTPMGHKLAGTLTLPKGVPAGKRVPAVVTITGSGLEDRDEHLPFGEGYRPFREFADALGRAGIAVLRMDDRGFGESGGNGAIATSADFAQDIRAGLAYLRTRPEIDAGRLGLLGHSEGGLIAPLVASNEPTLRGIILLAGTAFTGRRILTFQFTNGINHDSSLTPEKRAAALANVSHMIDSIAGAQPWMKFFVDYDPLATARKVKTPVLVLNGATDQQVTPDQVPELVAAFKQAGNKDVTSHIFPEMNHLFVHDPNGFPGGYTKLPSMKVEPTVITTVVDWFRQRLGSGLTP